MQAEHSIPPLITETPKHSSRSGERSGSRSPYGHSHSLTNTPKKIGSKKNEQDAWIKKLALKLEDNRYKGGDKEAIKRLQELNRLENTSNKLLKRILNVIFISTGICLLLAVIVVIVYTAIVKPDLSINHHSILNRQGFKSIQENSPVFYYETNNRREPSRDKLSPIGGPPITADDGNEDSKTEEYGPDNQFVYRNSRQTQANRPLPSRGCKLTALVREGSVQWAKICSESESRDEDHGYIEAADMK